MSASFSSSQQQETVQNIDNSATTADGDVLALSNNNLTVNEGGSLTVVNKDPQAALAAIEAIKNQSESLVSAITGTAAQLAQGSNAIATKVSESQAAFVESASGQKYVLYIVGGLAAVLLLPAMFSRQK